MTPKTATIAIAGNPNSGKTTVFNMLTGSRQTVGNYPGVTVEQKTGICRIDGDELKFVDLPGTYSLTAFSLDELVARRFVVDERPDIILAVVDASNLERNLYLTLQLAEMGIPMVVALNMHDIAVQRGIRIDIARLSTLLASPVVVTVGSRGEGRGELLACIRQTLGLTPPPHPCRVHYPPVIEDAVAALQALIAADPGLGDTVPQRWEALKLLEEDEEEIDRVRRLANSPTGILDKARGCVSRLEHSEGHDAATLVAEHRYGHAAGIVREAVVISDHGRTLTDAVDTLVCSRFLGFFFVGVVIFLAFKVTFLLADGIPFVPWFSGWTTPAGVFSWFFDELLPQLTAGMAEGPLKSLINDGIIAGVGGVMGFVPLIFFMFLVLATIEDSGYIARIAFVLDRVLRSFGLQGKSILAMIVSGGIAGGCAVPGVMATRTLREERDRLTTMLVAPFMNCGAKLPVYAMLIAAFFARYKSEMLWLLAMLSWLFALSAAWLLRKFVIKGDQTPFVMELPPYHVPQFRGVLRSAAERSWMYMKKAGTIILGVSIIIWALMYFPRSDVAPFAGDPAGARAHQLRNSLAGQVGRGIETVSRAAGFDWRDNIALIGGFAAKEIVVSTMAMAYSLGEAGELPEDGGEEHLPLVKALRSDPAWNPLRAFSLLIFVMLYAPCMATVVAIWKESGSWKWAAFSTIYSTAVAFVAATTIYQAGKLLGL